MESGARYPFSNPLREARVSINSITSILPPRVVLDQVDAALENDPLNPLLLYHKAIQEVRNMDIKAARITRGRLAAIGPDWAETKNLGLVIDAVAKQLAP